MHCPTCNAANPDANRFCESCGAAFTQPCPACGYACGASAKYCGGCGVEIERRDGALVAKIQPVPAADTWGELKQATVLFADIVGSTEHIAGLDPEQAMERLRPVLYTLCEAVERFGGTVIRTLGDGVMALFGVPKTLKATPCWPARPRWPWCKPASKRRTDCKSASACTPARSPPTRMTPKAGAAAAPTA